MRTRKVLIALTGAAVIAAATACGTSNTPHQSASNSPSPATTLASTAATTTPAAQPTPAAGAQSACADLGGTVDANQVCHALSSGPGYKATFTFPVDYPDQQTLIKYLTQRRADFIGFAKETPPRNHPYELDAKAEEFRSGTPTAGTASLVFQEYSDSGGAHPVTGYQAFNYDLGKGAPITFDTLFKPDTNPVEVLDPIVQREMDRHWQGYGGPAQENTLGAKVYQDFALTDDTVIFFIGQGMWLPEAGGPQQISVPRSELASVLA